MCRGTTARIRAARPRRWSSASSIPISIVLPSPTESATSSRGLELGHRRPERLALVGQVIREHELADTQAGMREREGRPADQRL